MGAKLLANSHAFVRTDLDYWPTRQTRSPGLIQVRCLRGPKQRCVLHLDSYKVRLPCTPSTPPSCRRRHRSQSSEFCEVSIRFPTGGSPFLIQERLFKTLAGFSDKSSFRAAMAKTSIEMLMWIGTQNRLAREGVATGSHHWSAEDAK